jgi:hypothetical protein
MGLNIIGPHHALSIAPDRVMEENSGAMLSKADLQMMGQGGTGQMVVEQVGAAAAGARV